MLYYFKILENIVKNIKYDLFIVFVRFLNLCFKFKLVIGNVKIWFLMF